MVLRCVRVGDVHKVNAIIQPGEPVIGSKMGVVPNVSPPNCDQAAGWQA
jgi:hypothetical protein